MKGVLRITDEENNLLVERENLIVYTGREFIASILFNAENTNISNNSNLYRISFWSLGNGGLLDPFDTTTLIIPSPNDNDLNRPISGFNPSRNDVTPNGRYKKSKSVSFLRDTTNNDRYLITIVTLRVEGDEFVNEHISEAGLFLSRYEDPKATNNDFKLFSKTTFPSIYKASGQILNFSWHFYT